MSKTELIADHIAGRRDADLSARVVERIFVRRGGIVKPITEIELRARGTAFRRGSEGYAGDHDRLLGPGVVREKFHRLAGYTLPPAPSVISSLDLEIGGPWLPVTARIVRETPRESKIRC